GLDIHDSTGDNTDGILEIGGSATDASAHRVTVTHNTFTAAHGGLNVHAGDRFAIPVSDLVFSYNVVSDASASDPPILDGEVGSMSFDSNVVSGPARISVSGAPASHRCNIYRGVSPGAVGFAIDSTERVQPLTA